jgi:ABC-2 type transport system permease protein
LPGVTEQLKLVARLRWNLFKNGLRRKNNRWDIVGMVFAAFFSGLLVLGLCVAFYAGAYAFLVKNRPAFIALLFWAIFIWWQLVPIFVAGFGANFEFRNLLRFPLRLRAFYILGLGYGFADFAAVSSIMWLASMAAATMVVRPQIFPAFALVCLLFVLISVTLERLIGSWLERLFANRRVRELMVGLFVLCLVSLNFLNPALHKWDRSGPQPQMMFPYLSYFSWLPPALAGKAASAATHADSSALLFAFTGLALWFAALSALLWLRYRAQYFGEELSEGSAPAARRIGRRHFSEGSSLRLFRPAIAAVIRKEFRYITRNGFSAISLLLPPIMMIFFAMQFAGKDSAIREHGLSPEVFYPAVTAYLILILISPAYNSFAFEGRGIQTYFMAPIRMRDVLVGKNIFLSGLVAVELAISLSALVWRIGFPGWPQLLSTVAAAVFAVAGQLTIANWSSLSFPKKMEIGKLKGQRNSGIAVWTAFGAQIAIGGIASVVLLLGRWFGNPWMPVGLFGAFTAAALGGYAASLDPLSRLAEQKKELLIGTLCR